MCQLRQEMAELGQLLGLAIGEIDFLVSDVPAAASQAADDADFSDIGSNLFTDLCKVHGLFDIFSSLIPNFSNSFGHKKKIPELLGAPSQKSISLFEFRHP